MQLKKYFQTEALKKKLFFFLGGPADRLSHQTTNNLTQLNLARKASAARAQLTGKSGNSISITYQQQSL